MNPDRIQIALFDGLPVDPFILDWCRMFTHVERVSRFRTNDTATHMDIWRNKVCDWFLNKTSLDAVLFLEHNKLPMRSALGVIASNDDIVGAEYTYRDCTDCHPEKGYLGTGCLRISRHALETMKKPWFDYLLADDGCSIQICSCQWFCLRAQQAGFDPKTVGQVARAIDAVCWLADGPGTPHIQRYEDFCKENRRRK